MMGRDCHFKLGSQKTNSQRSDLLSEDLKEERTRALDLGTRVQEEGTASAKVPQVDVFLEYLRNSEAANATGAEPTEESSINRK